MIIEILEVKFPAPFDREQVEDWVNNVAKPADEKAGCKMSRYTWTHTGGPMNILTCITEFDSLAGLERVYKEQKYGAEFSRRFPNAEGSRSKILEVI